MSDNQNGLCVAVVGATGLVGQEVLKTLLQRKFPIKQIIPFASERSKGKKIQYGNQEFECQVLEKGCFEGVDLSIFDVADELSSQWVPEAAKSSWVIDKSARFRMDPKATLIVPEVNKETLRNQISQYGQSKDSSDRVIASPNCTTAPLVVVLKSLLKFGIKRVVVSTYQSTSGAGMQGMEELKSQTKALLEGEKVSPSAFSHQIAFSCIPQIGGFKEDGYTSEEHKTIHESRKILDLPNLQMTTTAVRVPTLRCHCESVNIEFEAEIQSIEEVYAALQDQEGLSIIDQPEDSLYPLAETHSEDPVPAGSGADPVYVGRVRRDPTVRSGVNLWLVSDNLRKGAALNAVQIAESLVEFSAF